MKHTLEQAMKEKGLETEIRNIVFHLMRNSIRNEHKLVSQSSESMNYLKRAGIQWERRVRKSLTAMSSELKLSLHCQPRNQAEKEDLSAKWEELSNFQIDLSSYRPVYAPKDLLEVLLSLKGPTAKQEADDVVPKWEFSHINLSVKNIFELRVLYSELLRNDTTIQDWQMTSEKVISANHAPLCQQVLKKGLTPTPLRGKLWATVLGSEIQDHVC